MNIRPALLSDAPVIRAIYEPFVRHTSVSFEIDPPSLAEMERRILKCSETHGYFVAEQAGSVFGFAYASQYRIRSSYQSSAAVSVYLVPEAHGRKLGRALYDALIAHLIKRGFHTVIGVITIPNHLSERMHEAYGFTHIGTLKDVGRKFGNWHDTAIYQLIISDTTSDVHR